MSDETVIRIQNISKSFKIFRDKPLTLKEKLLRLRSNEYSAFQALKNVSFEIKKGQTVGLIGHNGCGKSTLLKLITKILYPDSGEIHVSGRISSLIELGAGFHPDFTGRENIYINASIFGLSKKEINGKIDEIIKFSELGEFIENPVRTYSSGMYMRLAFSVAINVNPEILLIDEILSVGDTNFQKKCFEKIEGFKRDGVTIVIVAHDLGTLEKLCDNIIWLDSGEVIQKGEADRIIDLYTQHMNKKYLDKQQEQYQEELKDETLIEQEESQININDDEGVYSEDIRWGSKEVVISSAYIKDSKGEATNVIHSGEEFEIEINYKVTKPQKGYIFGIGFYSLDKTLIYGNNTEIDRIKIDKLNHEGKVKFRIIHCPLLTGVYKLNVAVVDEHHRALDFIKYYMDFRVVSNEKSVGIVSVKGSWEYN
jgi:ABC-2 type transport system ATP-binding protein/lipopolysaccharide transport system ATP-binding protein